MNTTIINDCRDANASGRQITKVATLLGSSVCFIGVSGDLEAAGNLIDTLDAFGENQGVVLANVAPRNGGAKKWPNGTPFCWFRYKKILVLASIDGLTLSLAKKLGLTGEVNVLDVQGSLDRFIGAGCLEEADKGRILMTQFRSYDFLPLAAAFLARGNDLPGERLDIGEIPDAPGAVWWIDSFGNCKTTLLYEDLESGISLMEKIGNLPYYPRLKDVPNNKTAIITGSSGLDNKRFLEIVVQGGNAKNELQLAVGDNIV
jgi:hypothetical protein